MNNKSKYIIQYKLNSNQFVSLSWNIYKHTAYVVYMSLDSIKSLVYKWSKQKLNWTVKWWRDINVPNQSGYQGEWIYWKYVWYAKYLIWGLEVAKKVLNSSWVWFMVSYSVKGSFRCEKLWIQIFISFC